MLCMFSPILGINENFVNKHDNQLILALYENPNHIRVKYVFGPSTMKTVRAFFTTNDITTYS